ncbi:hypothetical protein AABM34_20350 [Lysinibacillus fusiformis]
MSKGRLKEVADLETGEMVEAWVPDNGTMEDFTVIHKDDQAKKDAYLKSKAIKMNFNILSGGFTFTMMQTLKDLIANTTFTQAEKTRIMFLGTYVSYHSETPYLTHSNGKPLLKSKLKNLLEIANKKEFYAFYNKLVEAGVMKEEIIDRSTVKLIWSEQYHFKGKPSASKVSSDNLIKTFDKQIREMYTLKNEKGKSVHTAHSLYNIFILMPYIHPESNALCKYPEKPYHASEPLTLQDLTDFFGYSRTNDTKRMLFKFVLHGMPVVAIAPTSESTRIFINPFVVNRTGKTPNATLFTMFDSSFNMLADRNGWSDKQKQAFLNQ